MFDIEQNCLRRSYASALSNSMFDNGMKLLATLAFTLAALTLSTTAHAHFIWAIPEATGRINFELTEFPGDTPFPLGPLFPSAKPFGLSDLAVAADKAHLHAQAAAGKPGGVSLLYGVHENSLILWSAKGAASLESAGQSCGLPLEILLKRAKSGLVATVLVGGKPVAGAQFFTYKPGSTTGIEAKTSAHGTVNMSAVHGVLALAAIAIHPTPGEFKGTHYNDKRDYGTLCVRL